jgi:hypothetical protein
LDDISITFRSLEEDEHHLRTLFVQHQRYEILINQAQYVFRAPGFTFLGYKVSAEGS